MGSLWAYSDDFGSLYDYFGLIVESLWVYAGRFSENTHLPNLFLMFLYNLGVNFGMRGDFGWHLR